MLCHVVIEFAEDPHGVHSDHVAVSGHEHRCEEQRLDCAHDEQISETNLTAGNRPCKLGLVPRQRRRSQQEHHVQWDEEPFAPLEDFFFRPDVVHLLLS